MGDNTSSKNKFAILSERGQTLVELAIAIPIILLVVVGIIEFGRAFYMKNSLTNAAREGARKAVVTASSNWDAVTLQNYVKDKIPFDTTNVSVSVPGTAPTSGSGNPVTVSVRLKFSTIVPNFYFPFKNITSISAQATMRYEQ